MAKRVLVEIKATSTKSVYTYKLKTFVLNYRNLVVKVLQEKGKKKRKQFCW